MKAKILVKRFKDEAGNPIVEMPKALLKGDWIDLRCAEETKFIAPQSNTLKYKSVNGEKQGYRSVVFDIQYIPLGIAMKLPKGYEAHVLPRSSTAKGMGLIETNSQGIIDYTYQGDNDEWKFPAMAIRDTTIKVGERICQFRIELSQKATIWQKIKWLFTSGVKFEEVEYLDGENREGFGSTGIK